jgi:hypothetical protein
VLGSQVPSVQAVRSARQMASVRYRNDSDGELLFECIERITPPWSAPSSDYRQ